MYLYNHNKVFADLSHQNGLRYSVENYDQLPGDWIECAGVSDEPMGEFWSSANGDATWADGWCPPMISAGHLYGKNVIGAEAFTSGDSRWRRHPGNMKVHGDRMFSWGINRFVFHAFSIHRFLGVAPEIMYSRWGLQYNNRNTWWEQSKNYHEYLTRCQYMLRQGNYVADIAYMEVEDMGYTRAHRPPVRPRNDYQWDICSTPSVLLMTVKNGKFTMPSGTSYSVLVLPDNDRMTLDLAKKLQELIKAGGTVVGYKKPIGTFGLTSSDKDVTEIVGTFWSFVIVGKTPEEVLAEKGIKPMFIADQKVNWLYRATGNEDIFFVANPANAEVFVTATFGTEGGEPKLYYPESGKTIASPIYNNNKVALPLKTQESVFVVFAKNAVKKDSIVAVSLDGKPIVDLQKTIAPTKLDIQIKKATYHDRDATEAVKKIVAGGTTDILVEEITRAVGDPAVGVLKTLTVEYTLEGKELSASAVEGQTIPLLNNNANFVPVGICPDNGLVFRESGKYELTFTSGKKVTKTFKLAEPVDLSSGWTVTFPVKGNTVTKTFDTLSSWSDNTDESVKYFSGTATYKKTFPSPNRKTGHRTILDLGQIEVVAEVKINGKNIGTFWQSSAKPDVTEFLKDGENTFEINVTNLWVNRLIGDAFLPDVPERQANGTLKAWPQWVLEGKPDPTGRQAFCMWNLWKKEDKPIVSGLLGPVRLITVGQ
jgi:hypothetical protein